MVIGGLIGAALDGLDRAAQALPRVCHRYVSSKLRHRQPVADGQRLDDVVELLVLPRVRLMGPGGGQHCGRAEEER